jgi:hypothetical protein
VAAVTVCGDVLGPGLHARSGDGPELCGLWSDSDANVGGLGDLVGHFAECGRVTGVAFQIEQDEHSPSPQSGAK